MPCSWEVPLSPIEKDNHAGIIPFQDIVPFQGIREEADNVVYPDLFYQLLDDDDNANDRSVMDTLLAVEVSEYAKATQLYHRKDLSDAAPPVSEQGTQQMLSPKAGTISIAASGSSEAGSSSSPIIVLDDSDDGGDNNGHGGGIGGGVGDGIGDGIGGGIGSGIGGSDEVPTIVGPIRDSSVLVARGKLVAVLKVLTAELKEKEEPKSGVKRSFAEFHRDSADSISDLIDAVCYEGWMYKGLAYGFKPE
ncbi:hypothetical protein ACEPPN_006514 [Leptodophora sp. 'Broadleaf-Isolate-01']